MKTACLLSLGVAAIATPVAAQPAFINHPRVAILTAQEYGAPRPGDQLHAGVDIDITQGIDDSFQSYIGGIVTRAEMDADGYGYYTDIFNAELGVVERIASSAELLVNVGDVVQAGDVVSQGESATGVVQLEYRAPVNELGQGGYGFEGTQDPVQFLAELGIEL